MDTIHNIDQYMSDLRQILAQGKKRIGVLLGAGAPVSINVADAGADYKPLIPAIEGLTTHVKKAVSEDHAKVISSVEGSLKENASIEEILSKIRSLSAALKGSKQKIGDYGQEDFDGTATAICSEIGQVVKCKLPSNDTPYNRLAGWIGGTDRKHPIEVFTSNYDLLLEEALESAKIPFFCGFSGFFEPFFDSASISNNDSLPPRWARLWKLHGSLGWGINEKGDLISGKGREATEMIYPDHLKYNQMQKLPYTALFERLRNFLMTPDTLLLTCGFSYADYHISTLIKEALEANPAASVFAFQFKAMKEEADVEKLAKLRPNFSAYATDRAIISCVEGKWGLAQGNNNKAWENIRSSFWGARGNSRDKVFTLGDFEAFATFFALSKSDQTYAPATSAPSVEAIK